MSQHPDLDRKAEALKSELRDLATELRDKDDLPADRMTAIEAEITAKSAALDKIEAEQRDRELDARLASLDDRLKSFTVAQSKTKAAAILAGVDTKSHQVKALGEYNEDSWLKALVMRTKGDLDAQQFVKSVLGTSDATGQAIVPNNFVGGLVDQLALKNIYRQLFEVVQVNNGSAVDVPYVVTAYTAALLQGAYGSNKDVRDFAFNQATATLYTIAQIADVGNQLLRQSNGAAERVVRNRLAGSIGMLEAQYITNGSGSSQPLGFFPALLAFGDVAAFKTTLSSESRVAAIGRGIGAMEARGVVSDNIVAVMHPTDYWELATETLGSSGSGGWAIDPAAGASASTPANRVWGVPVYRDPNWPAAKVGTALLIDRTEPQIFTGDQYRIDVSSEAGSRFDQNITGFRAEEEFGFNAEPYVRTGRVQQVIGI